MEGPGTVSSALKEMSATATLVSDSLEEDCCHLCHPLDSTLSQRYRRINTLPPLPNLKRPVETMLLTTD